MAQWHIDAAIRDLDADRNYECLWLRGLPPLGLLPCIDRQSPSDIIVGNAAAAAAEDGHDHYSDGTLGKNGKLTNLAHGGWGWAILDPNNVAVAGRCGLLEGDVQTVPRAELRALLSILEHAARETSITVRVDASYLLGFRDDPAKPTLIMATCGPNAGN
jgi:hypothetical protein